MTAVAQRSCEHPGAKRRRDPDDENMQACTACGQTWPIGESRPDTPVPVTPDQAPSQPARQGNGLRFIDPQHVLPGAVEREIVDVLDRMETCHGQLSVKADQMVRAEVSYELAYQRALFRSAAKSADARKAEATLTVADEYREVRLLQAEVRALRETGHHLRAGLSGLQTVARGVGAAS